MRPGILCTIAPTPYLLLFCHFQLSAALMLYGYAVARRRSYVRLRRVGAAVIVSAVVFVLAWLLYDGWGWGFRPRVHDEIIKLSFGPALAVLSPVALNALSLRAWPAYGAILMLAGIMVSLMMVLNDVFL